MWVSQSDYSIHSNLDYKSIKKKYVHQSGLIIMLLSVCNIKCIVEIKVFVEPQILIHNLFLQHT